MSLSPETIDRIVANVLNQLGSPEKAAPAIVASSNSPATTAAEFPIDEAVITAELLESIPQNGIVTVRSKAIITPAGRDTLKARNLQLQRSHSKAKKNPSQAATTPEHAASSADSLLIVVRSSRMVDQLWEDLSGRWNRELLGCVDDASKLAISAICRGESSNVVILAEQTFRAACLSNRNDKVKAVSVSNISDIQVVRKQLRANVWAFDPTRRSYFELKNFFRQIET